jgi:hypothetical protein
MHMVAATPSIQLRKFSARKRAALLRRAKDLGMTPSAYVQHLIDADLKLEHEARTKSLWELGAPLTKALQGLSEDELDDLVDKARRTPRGARSR